MSIDPDHTVISEHEVTIRDQCIPYRAMAGMQPVWDTNGRVEAGLFFTYYERSDTNDRSSRPLLISFNGGPGSSSMWMMLGYTGPRIVQMDHQGYPIQPHNLKDNPFSVLDVTDIVFIDPVNTGFSRPLNCDNPESRFFGVNAEIKYLAEWINTFVTRISRWASPKYLIGQGYGSIRVSGLALELQKQHWMFVNGVMLVSPTTHGIYRDDQRESALRLPFMTATAWYHKRLPADLQVRDLADILPEVEAFVINELVPAMSKGGFIDSENRKAVVDRMTRYSGISEKAFLQHNLDLPLSFFRKELLRDEGYTLGLLDSRYKGIDRRDAGEQPDFDAERISWNHSFTPSINVYLREELNYKTDLKYNIFSSLEHWDWDDWAKYSNLRLAMAQNPCLHVLIQSGYYDGECDYFNAKYSMWQLDASGKLKDRLSWEGFRSGHMMLMNHYELEYSNESLRKFIHRTTPASDTPAKY